MRTVISEIRFVFASAFIVLTFLGFVESSFANVSVCDVFRASGQEKKLENCEFIVKQGLVPNQKAFGYTINYLIANQDRLRYPECAVRGIDRSDFFCFSCRDERWVLSGFQNQCSFIINDLNRPWPANSTQTTAYFVDLCASDPTKLVRPFYVNIGTGPRYDDSPDRGTSTRDLNKSTLAGAFKIDGRVYDIFEPYSPRAYEAIKRRSGGKLYYLGMIGLNSSNNTTDTFKPMHVSPFKSSWGCPSVSESTANDFKRMVANGSTLYMAYAGPKFEENGSCTNDKSDR